MDIVAQINERMGNTGGCLWGCPQFSSTQNEPYERGEIVQQLLDRGWFHYLGPVKKCKR